MKKTRRIHAKIILVILLMKGHWAYQTRYNIKGVEIVSSARINVCPDWNKITVFSGFAEKEIRLSFQVNPNDPADLKSIQNKVDTTADEYKILPRKGPGSECYTLAGNRYQFIGLIFLKKDEGHCD